MENLTINKFNVNNNNITTIHKNAFKNCELEFIYMAYNKISFDSDDNQNLSPFRNCKKLKDLELAYNNISKIYDDWRKIDTLDRLNLFNNSIKYVEVSNNNKVRILFCRKKVKNFVFRLV